MKIKKSHLLKGKKYIVIIEAEEEIVEEKVYPATFKEVHMADKIPKWFVDWEKANSSKPPQWFMEFYAEFKEFKTNQKAFNKNITKDIKDIKKDIQLMKSTPTMKLELKQDN